MKPKPNWGYKMNKNLWWFRQVLRRPQWWEKDPGHQHVCPIKHQLHSWKSDLVSGGNGCYWCQDTEAPHNACEVPGWSSKDMQIEYKYSMELEVHMHKIISELQFFAYRNKPQPSENVSKLFKHYRKSCKESYNL